MTFKKLLWWGFVFCFFELKKKEIVGSCNTTAIFVLCFTKLLFMEGGNKGPCQGSLEKFINYPNLVISPQFRERENYKGAQNVANNKIPHPHN